MDYIHDMKYEDAVQSSHLFNFKIIHLFYWIAHSDRSD